MIVAAQPLIRDMLGRWLGRLGGNTVVDTLASTAELARHLRREGGAKPDLVVIGCPALPPEEISATVPDIGVLPQGVPMIVVADSAESALIGVLIRRGVRGYVPTWLESDVADAAIKLVLAGGTYVPPSVVDQPPETRPSPVPPQASGDPPEAVERALALTPREVEVLVALKAGMSNRGIADAMGISESTVMVHIRNLMRKVGATNRTEAVYMALRRRGEAGQTLA